MACHIPMPCGRLLVCDLEVAFALPRHGVFPDLVVNLTPRPARGAEV